MAAETVEARVKEIICEQLWLNEEEVRPDSEFITDLGADSLDIVELVMVLEEEYNFRISDEDAGELRTVRDLVNYIERHQ